MTVPDGEEMYVISNPLKATEESVTNLMAAVLPGRKTGGGTSLPQYVDRGVPSSEVPLYIWGKESKVVIFSRKDRWHHLPPTLCGQGSSIINLGNRKQSGDLQSER